MIESTHEVILKSKSFNSKGELIKEFDESKKVKNIYKNKIKNLFKINKSTVNKQTSAINNTKPNKDTNLKKKNNSDKYKPENPKNKKSKKQIELESKIKDQKKSENKIQKYNKKIKENIKLAQKRTEFLSNWEKTMTYTGLFNKMHQTFSPNDLAFTKFGAEARVYIPWGYNYKHLTSVRETLQNNLQCTVVLTSYVNKNYIDAKFIYIEDCNKIKFKPVPAKPYELFLGVDESGEPILVDINSEPHILVAGSTRSGKNGTLDHIITNLIYNCTEDEINIYLLQGAKGDTAKYRNCKQVCKFAFCDDEDIIMEIIKNIYNEMKIRRDLFLNTLVDSFKDPNLKDYNKKFPDKKLPYIYIIVDEIMAVVTKAMKDKKSCQFEIIDLLEKIAEHGGAYGITYVISHQKPEVKLMPSFCKNMSNVRICYGFRDAVCSAIVLGDGRYEAVGLPPRKAYVTCKAYEGYLYTLDLTDNIYKYVKDSIVKPIKKEEKTNSNNDTDKDDGKNKKSNKQNNNNLNKENIIDTGIKQLQKQNKKSKSLEIVTKAVDKPQDKLNETIKQQTNFKPNHIKNDFSKVHPQTKEEILLENISKIEGYVPYVPPRSKE